MSSPCVKRQKVDKEKGNPTPPDFQSFAPDGNVVFVVNNDTRVRVHSAAMKGASRVFATMLGPNFMEGQALAAANTETDLSEIALPEEESSICFGWICRALHCQSATTLWNPTSAEILKVWSIIDKYDMKQSMHLSVMFWSQHILSKTCHSKDLWPMALVCFQNNDSASYKTVTKKLLLGGGSFWMSASETEKLVKNDMPGRFLFKLAAKLHEVRIDVQRNAAELVYNELPSLISSNDCHSETKAYFNYLLDLMQENSHRICFLGLEAPLSRIDWALSELGNWLSRHGTPHRSSCDDCEDVQELLYQKIKHKKPQIRGLCLGCFEGIETCPEHKK